MLSSPTAIPPSLPSPITILGPHPLLAIDIERATGGDDDIHLHAGGQGVWVARMAATLGAHPVLCGFIGGESGAVLEPLLTAMPGSRHLVQTSSASGSYVMDRRSGTNQPYARSLSPAPSRHELDDLAAVTIASALRTRMLVLCNPFPGDTLTAEFYERVVSDVRPHGVTVLADLSSPRLEGALAGGVDIVKINDWELAQYVCGPVAEPDEMAAAVGRMRDAGARMVVITRGELPAAVFSDEGRWELTAPRFEHGFREGCGDSMMGAMAAVLARGGEWREALTVGAAAGAANFLRRGLGTGSPSVIHELAPTVTLRPLPVGARTDAAAE